MSTTVVTSSLGLPASASRVSLNLPKNLQFKEWREIGGQIQQIESGVMWWVGDWWRFGNQAYGERAAQVLDSESYSYQTFKDAGWVAGRIERSRRRDLLSWSHHKEVAALEPKNQDRFLDLAIKKNWSRNELRREVSDYSRGVVRKGLSMAAELAGKFSVIYADPPWSYRNSGLRGSAEEHYPTMDTEKIKEMGKELEPFLMEDCVLFLWTPSPLLEDAFSVMEAWPFSYKANFVWVKNRSTYGRLAFFVRGQHEVLLVGTRGSFTPDGELFSSVIEGDQKEHSRKPAVVYEMIEKMYPHGPYLELFARGKRAGWEVWGNEVT